MYTFTSEDGALLGAVSVRAPEMWGVIRTKTLYVFAYLQYINHWPVGARELLTYVPFSCNTMPVTSILIKTTCFLTLPFRLVRHERRKLSLSTLTHQSYVKCLSCVLNKLIVLKAADRFSFRVEVFLSIHWMWTNNIKALKELKHFSQSS